MTPARVGMSVAEALAKVLADGTATVGRGVALPAPGEGPAAPAKVRAGAAESEAGWQKRVIELAELYAWIPAHFRKAHVKDKTGRGRDRYVTPVGAQGKGFPDLLMIHSVVAGRMFVAELKSKTGRLRAEQKKWLELFRWAGIPAFVWRPADWPEVQAFLKGART